MKKRNVGAAAVLALCFAVSSFGQKGRDLVTVPLVNLDRYKGQWFEIAKYPNKFQRDCVANTTANYSVKSNGKLEVKNTCVKKDGTTKTAIGEAKVVENSSNAKLKVRFAPGILSWLPAVWGDYWIIYLDDKYENVAIGEPDRDYFWILSRKATMSDALYQDILRRAERLGFAPGRVEKTPQNAEVLKGSVMIKN